MRVLSTLVVLLGLCVFFVHGQEEIISTEGGVQLISPTETLFLFPKSFVVDGIGYYFSGLTPTIVWAVNLTQLSTPGINASTIVPLARVALNETNGDDISTIQILPPYLFTASTGSLYRFDVNNLAAVSDPRLDYPTFHPTHSFTSDRDGTTYMYFVLREAEAEGLPIIRLDTSRILEPLSNSSVTLHAPDAASIVSIAKGTNYTYLAEYTSGDAAVIFEWSFAVENVTRSFTINDLLPSQSYFYEPDNALYICGNQASSGQPVMVSVDLNAVVAGSVYTMHMALCNTTAQCKAISAVEPVRAAQIGEDLQFCSAIDYDPNMGAIFGGLYDGLGVGSVVRTNKLFMELKDPFIFLEDNRQPSSIHVVPEERLIYAATDLTVYFAHYPTVCPSDCKEEIGRGECIEGTCVCTPGYISEDCNELACASDCGESEGRGECNNGVCFCGADWTGANCTDRRCPNDCFESQGRGVCGGEASNYTCTCNQLWTSDPNGVQDCSLPTFLTCSARPNVDDCVRTAGCGWCQTTSRCQTGSVVGPSAGACEEWLVANTREIGTFIVAIIFIAIFGTMLVLNFLSAMVVDYQTASLLNAENLLTVEFLKETYWRDERSAKAWKLFDQLQFISYYTFLGAAFSTRLVGFTKYFNWAMLLLPLPFYQDTSDHPDRTLGGVGTGGKRSLLNAEQVAGTLTLGPEQLFYAVMFWFMILLFICLVVYAIFALFFWLIYRGKEPNIGTVLRQKVFYVITRVVMIAYMPVCITASYHLKSGYGAVAVASAISLIVVGILPIIFNAVVVWNKTKELLFLYLKLRFGALYAVYHYEKARFNLVVLLRKFLVGIMLGFLAVNATTESTLIYSQVGVIIFIYVAYIVALFIIQPYLDQVHTVTDIACCVFNAIAVGISLVGLDATNNNQPTASATVGEIVAAICVLLSFAMCVVAFGHSWYNMSSKRTSPLILCRGVPKPGEGIYEDDPEANKNAAEMDQKGAAKEESSSDSLHDDELESSSPSSEEQNPRGGQPEPQADEDEEGEEEDGEEEVEEGDDEEESGSGDGGDDDDDEDEEEESD